MAITIGGLAKTSTTIAMTIGKAEAKAGGAMGGLSENLAPKSKSEAQALAIGKVAEANIIQPKKKSKGIGMLGQEKKSKGKRYWTRSLR